MLSFLQLSFSFCLILQKEFHLDDELVRQQIRYTGLLEMIQVQKSGYNAKYTFKVLMRGYYVWFTVH